MFKSAYYVPDLIYGSEQHSIVSNGGEQTFLA